MDNILEFKDVYAGYTKDEHVLKNISFSLEYGDKVGLIGANGAGKSTLFRASLGLMPHTGSIKIKGLEIQKKNFREIRKTAGLLLQDSENQMFMPKVIEDITFGPLNYGMTQEGAINKAEEVLKSLDVMYLKDKANHRISGGEKRMAAIAAVLAMEPELIFMDEPTSNLDPKNRRKLINIIKNLHKTVIIATHDLDMVLDTCNRVMIINDGMIVRQGDTDEILRDRDLLESNGLELPLCFQIRK